MVRKMLYPPPETGEAGPSTLKSNSYEPFRLLDTRIEEGLRGMAEEEQQRMGDTEAKGINGTSGSLPRASTSFSLRVRRERVLDESTIKS